MLRVATSGDDDVDDFPDDRAFWGHPKAMRTTGLVPKNLGGQNLGGLSLKSINFILKHIHFDPCYRYVIGR